MREQSVVKCLSIAVWMLAASAGQAAPTELCLPKPKDESMAPIQRCVVESIRVDGLMVVQHGWCWWDYKQCMWIPLSSDLARHRVFGIRPIPE